MPEHQPQKGWALVTGASRGIGAAVARQLGEDGWPVALNYRSNDAAAEQVAAEMRAQGLEVRPVRADVCDGDAVNRMFDDLESELGPALVVVNCAGTRADSLVAEISERDWDLQVQTNLRAPVQICQRAIRLMLRARFGRIINIASIVGIRANAGQSVYAATKSGLVAFSKCLAVEVARRNITVNVIAPGFIPTDLTADVNPDDIVPHIPARRPGTPEDVAACARFLASPAAGYVTASVLTVDGGLSA